MKTSVSFNMKISFNLTSVTKILELTLQPCFYLMSFYSTIVMYGRVLDLQFPVRSCAIALYRYILRCYD